jgi:hypothetical protein
MMNVKARNSKGLKPSKGEFRKRIVAENNGSAATLTGKAQETESKRYERVRVTAAAKQLAPWFDIANGLVGPPLLLAGYVHDLPLDTYFEPLKRNVVASFEMIISIAERIRTNDPDYFERFARLGRLTGRTTGRTAGSIPLYWSAESSEFWGDPAISPSGRLVPSPADLQRQFKWALYGTELFRFRRCPVCQHFFYRTRSDNKGDGCSDDCNNTLRQQRWRASRINQSQPSTAVDSKPAPVKQSPLRRKRNHANAESRSRA